MFLLALLTTAWFLPLSSGEAHKGATGIVKQRMHLMASIQSKMKSVVTMLRGKMPFDKTALEKAARDIANDSKRVPASFKVKNIDKPSEARAEIWQQWARFVRLSEDMERAADNLSRAASTSPSAEALARHFKQLAATCSACHRQFRQKKGR